MNGSYYVGWCGRFFTGKAERRHVIEWLQNLMEETRWPLKTSMERLRRIWAGEDVTLSVPGQTQLTPEQAGSVNT
jgi:hypothetical protein